MTLGCLAVLGSLLVSHPADPAVVLVQEVASGQLVLTVQGPSDLVSGLTVQLAGDCAADEGGGLWRCGAGERRLVADGVPAGRGVLIRVVAPGQPERSGVLTVDQPEFDLSPTAANSRSVSALVRMGISHILSGPDHLLFLTGLLLLIASWRRLLLAVSAFTVGHSLTLAAQVLGVVVPPAAVVETLIALSLVLLAREVVRSDSTTLLRRRPELAAALFGLFHGFGFAGALAEVGLSREAILAPLFGFNLGVETGQIAFVVALGGALWLARRLLKPVVVTRWVTPGLGYLVGALGMFWVIERAGAIWPT